MRASVLATLAVACWPPLALAADPPAGQPPADQAPVIDVDPNGMPPGVGRKPQTAVYHLWHDGGVWHLRCGSEGRRRFAGVIRVQGGKVAKLVPVVVEPRRKPRKADRGMLSRDRTRIEYDFVTDGGTDGFDFQITPGDEATLEFNLQIDGTALPARIAIGPKAQPAPSIPFTLSARPRPAAG
jgi:hypothetical protein